MLNEDIETQFLLYFLIMLCARCNEVYEEMTFNNVLISLIILMQINEPQEPIWLKIVIQRMRRIHSEQRVTVSGFSALVRRYPDIQFLEDFRMSRSQFKVLENGFGEQFAHSCYVHFPVRDRLLLTVWTLATKESFRVIGNRFGTSRGNAHRIFIKTCKMFAKKSLFFIKWPDAGCYQSIANKFTFPQTIGAIDSSYIRISQPLKYLSSYTNRKKFTAISLQAVCDADMRFTDISAGWPSSMNDARIYKRSTLSRALQEKLSGTEYHLIGDSAYPLQTILMTPHKNYGALTSAQKTYNYALSASRSVIERAFCRLKQKWRRMKGFEINNLFYATDIIVAACCLHNFVLGQNDYNEFDELSDDENDEDESERDSSTSDEEDEDAVEKRNYLTTYFSAQFDDNNEMQ